VNAEPIGAHIRKKNKNRTYLIEVRVSEAVDAADEGGTRVVLAVRGLGVEGPLAQPVSLQITHACSHVAAKSATATIGGPAAANIAKISASATTALSLAFFKNHGRPDP